jgi:hypothetical protein
VGIEPDGLMQAVGRTPNGKKVKKDLFPWTASGRAIANGRDEGVTKLLFDDSPEAHGHGKILGGGMVGTHAGDMIGEVALAIEMGADAVDIGKTIHPHPTLGESIGMHGAGSGAWQLHGCAAGAEVELKKYATNSVADRADPVRAAQFFYCKACNTAAGLRSMTLSKTNDAPLGERSPRSQWRSVATEKPKRAANCSWVRLRRSRRLDTSTA